MPSVISLIAIIDEQYGLGKDNQLLCHLPADLEHFKAITLGKPIIMGKKTYLSIGRPLPGRLNIIVSRTMQPTEEGVSIVSSLEEALQMTVQTEEVMIIGGAQLFAEALPLAQRLYITQIHHTFAADVFFPKFDKAAWYLKEERDRPKDQRNPYDLTFYCYERSDEALSR